MKLKIFIFFLRIPKGGPRPPAPQPGRQMIGLKHSSSEDSASKGRGARKFLVFFYAN